MANVQFLSIQDCWKQHMFFFVETCYVVHFNNPFKVLQRKDKVFFLDINGKRVSVSIDRCKPAFFLNTEDLQLPQTKNETSATLEPNATAPTPATVEHDPTASTPTQSSTRSGRKVHLPTRPENSEQVSPKTARLVGCSCSALFSIYAKWINDGETSSRHLAVGPPRIVKVKGHQRLSYLVKQNQSKTLDQLTAQYNALLDMGLHSKRPTCEPLLTKHHCQLNLEWAQKH
ncbi:HTH_Tnp_Tc3_2 domain-containing protein [Trichonephila clavipes]|nr:HTH_Tnp_Tc3_2 domain-containing protein [Trichonephila clavipes]